MFSLHNSVMSFLTDPSLVVTGYLRHLVHKPFAQTVDQWQRTLHDREVSETGSRSQQGTTTLMIFFIISTMFCCLWMLTCCGYRIVRPGRLITTATTSIEVLPHESRYRTGSDERFPRELSLNERQELVANALVTRPFIPKGKDTVGDMITLNSDCIPIREHPEAPENNISCPICIMDFENGEEVCSSRNEQCTHMFHEGCIMEWLLRHDDCPCCRQNYFSSKDDEKNQFVLHRLQPFGISDVDSLSSDESMTESFRRGISLFRMLSRSSDINPTMPSPHLEGEPLHDQEGMDGIVHQPNLIPNQVRTVGDVDDDLEECIDNGDMVF